ncbi:MAG: CoA transferase, partial [Stackebrandtia sp.]
MITSHAGLASAVATEHLRMLGCNCATVEWDVDWAGPVEVAMHDEAQVQAACGIMAIHGRRYGRPTVLPVPYASTVAGVLATQGVLAALVDRHRGGGVRRVSTSVAQAALLAVSQYLAAATTDDDWPERYSPGGPPFTAAEGARFEIETFDAERWQRFWRLLSADRDAIANGWPPFQRRFATASCPLPHGLHEAAARHPYQRVVAAARDAEVSMVAVNHTPVLAPPWQITPLPPTGGHQPAPETRPLPQVDGRQPGPGTGPLPPGGDTRQEPVTTRLPHADSQPPAPETRPLLPGGTRAEPGAGRVAQASTRPTEPGTAPLPQAGSRRPAAETRPLAG